MKSINWQTIGYVILGIFMLICYAYVDGKEILKKIIPDYKLVNDNGYFEILNDDGEMSIFCISKSVRDNAKNTYSFNYIDSWSDPPLELYLILKITHISPSIYFQYICIYPYYFIIICSQALAYPSSSVLTIIPQSHYSTDIQYLLTIVYFQVKSNIIYQPVATNTNC